MLTRPKDPVLQHIGKDEPQGNVRTVTSVKERRPHGWRKVAALAFLAILPHSNGLWGSFHFDDTWDIVENEHIRTIEGLAEARPMTRWVTYASLYANYRIHGLDWMPGWHIGNIVLHAGCVVMLYQVLRRTTKGAGHSSCSLVPFVAAALFAVHPMASEPVNYIRARAVILCTLFALLALLGIVLALRSDSLPTRITGGIMVGVGVVLAGMSKEVGGLYALGMVVLYWFAFAGPVSFPKKRPVLWTAGILLVMAGGMAAWFAATDVLHLAERLVLSPRLSQHFLAQTLTFWKYLSLAVLPLPGRLTVDHHVEYFPLRHYSALEADVLLAMLGIVFVLVLAILTRKRAPLVTFLILCVVLGLTPYFFVVTVDMLVEYKFYPSLAALCALAAVGLARLHLRAPRIAPFAIVLCCVSLATMTFVRNDAWQSERTLWEDAVQKAPRRARTLNVLAWVLATDPKAPDAPGALDLAKRSFDRRYADPWPGYDPLMADTLAETYFANGLYPQAIQIEQEILRRGQGPLPFFQKQMTRFVRAAGGTTTTGTGQVHR